MRKIFLIPLIILGIVSLFYSCQMDYPVTNSSTVILPDTIRIHDTIRIYDTVCLSSLTKPQLLVQKIWRIDYVQQLINGVFSNYSWGSSNTTGINYDNYRFKFNTGGSGTVTDQFNNTYRMVWQFTSSDYRTIELTVNGRTDIWRMVELSGNYLHSSTNLILSGNSNNLETHRLIQMP